MARRFSVIQGGLSGVLDTVPAPEAPDAGVVDPEATGCEATTWRVDLRRPGAVDAGAVGAWRALLVRQRVSDPLRDPDHLLPLAWHRPAGRRVAVALAWSRDGAAPETLRGVVPLAMPHPVWGGRARAWEPAEAGATALVDLTAAAAVDAALRVRLKALRRPVRLAGAIAGARGPAPVRLALVSDRASPARAIPARSLLGVRPEGWEPPAGAEVVTVSEPAAVRDAVESFLALDARTAPTPIVADPSEASLVRVVSRLFARRNAMRVELFRRAGEIVAGTLHIGTGSAAVAWRRARV